MAVGYCDLAGHWTDEMVHSCATCNRKFCPLHGSIDKGLCSDCLAEEIKSEELR